MATLKENISKYFLITGQPCTPYIQSSLDYWRPRKIPRDIFEIAHLFVLAPPIRRAEGDTLESRQYQPRLKSVRMCFMPFSQHTCSCQTQISEKYGLDIYAWKRSKIDYLVVLHNRFKPREKYVPISQLALFPVEQSIDWSKIYSLLCNFRRKISLSYISTCTSFAHLLFANIISNQGPINPTRTFNGAIRSFLQVPRWATGTPYTFSVKPLLGGEASVVTK